MKVTISWVVFLILSLMTLTAWIGFEFYHQKTTKEIPQELITQSENPLPTSFDKDTLNKLYEGKDKFFEITNTPVPTTTPQK